MKASLQLNVSHQLTLTPQLQQAIRLLQLSTIDLRQEILHQVEENPLLEATHLEEELLEPLIPTHQAEEVSDFQWSTLYASKPNAENFNENSYVFESLHCTKENLKDHLTWQIDLSPFNEVDKVIATAIIDAIDEDGFLTQTVEEIQKSLSSSEYPINTPEVEAVLHRIQRLDPVGCGASSLAEALLIQLEQNAKSIAHFNLTKEIISNDLTLLAHHNYTALGKKYSIDGGTLEQVIDNILHLHPKPGTLIAVENPGYVIPDLLVKKRDGLWQVMLNPECLPKVNINSAYANLIKGNKNPSDKNYLKTNLKEAKWFLKSIQSRQETLLRVAEYIVAYQQPFFERGEEAMKPLILKDVAEALQLHESTISRVTTQKYLMTPKGTYELKFFFSSHISSNNGQKLSSTAIKALIKKMIADEKPKKPLSDNKIVTLLGEKDISIARRTIAKYREDMGIPPSNERKRI